MSTTPFAFVPRKLTKTTGPSGSSAKPSTSKVRLEDTLEKQSQLGQTRSTKTLSKPEDEVVADTQANLKKRGMDRKKGMLDEDSSRTLLELSLSDHAIWSDSDLLRRMDESSEGCEWSHIISKKAH